MEEAYEALNKIAAEGGKVLYVGTKKQAQEVCKEEAERSNMYYMTERWLGRNINKLQNYQKKSKSSRRNRKNGKRWYI